MKTSRSPKETPELNMEAETRRIAHQLWEEEGRPEGKAEEHWAKACLVVMTVTRSELETSPVWLKRPDEDVAPQAKVEATSEEPAKVESINKRTATRHAA